MKAQKSTCKLLGQLTLSLSLLTSSAYAEVIKDNASRIIKSPKSLISGNAGRDIGETIPFQGELPNGKLDNYEQLLKDLNPSGAPSRTADLIKKLQEPEN